MRPSRRTLLQVESLESIVALSVASTVAPRSAVNVAATPADFELSGVLRGTVQLNRSPDGSVGARFGPINPSKTTRGAVSGHLATLGPAQLTGDLSSEGSADGASRQWNASLVLWSDRGPLHMSFDGPDQSVTPTPAGSLPVTLHYTIVPSMSGPRPTLYAPGSGTITIALRHLRPGRGGSESGKAILTFTPDPAPSTP